jgi:hypothetical protein
MGPRTQCLHVAKPARRAAPRPPPLTGPGPLSGPTSCATYTDGRAMDLARNKSTALHGSAALPHRTNPYCLGGERLEMSTPQTAPTPAPTGLPCEFLYTAERIPQRGLGRMPIYGLNKGHSTTADKEFARAVSGYGPTAGEWMTGKRLGPLAGPLTMSLPSPAAAGRRSRGCS